ncbi:MAG: T9SS type A sorting domain-containing protein, partial [Phaeodactylibacter sp.]|nr:T9SS type A sorting domain-containing protein [Phaeodactylibacter sp.]
LWSLGVSSRIGWWDGQSANLLSDGEEGFRLADGQQLSYDPASGRLWALDWGGLQQYDGQAWTPVEFPFEQDTTQFEYIYTFSARNNRIVIATNLRIFIYENEEWFTYSSANAPLANEDIREVAMTQSGKLWVLHQSTSNIEVGQWSLASGASPESKTHQVKKAFVYPNPVEEKAFIDGISGNGEGLIQLFDAQGRLARSMQATFSEGQPSEITRLNLPPGFYTGRVFLNGEVYVFKLVKRN